MTETPKAKRVTRAASTKAGSATPAPSASTRRTRAKGTPKAAPLPAVPTAISHAYGATGKVSLATQINLTGGEGSFAAAFSANRHAAVGRNDDDDQEDDAGVGDEDEENGTNEQEVEDEEDVVVQRPPPRLPTHQYHHVHIEEVIDEEEEEEEVEVREESGDEQLPNDSGSYTGSDGPAIINGVHYPSFTDLDTAFSYAGSAAGHAPSAYTAASLEPPATRAEIEAAQPGFIEVLWESLLRWIRMPWYSLTEFSSVAKTFGILSLVSLVLLAAFLPAARNGISSSGASLYHKAGHIIGDYLPHTGFRLPYLYKPVASDLDLAQRVETLEIDVRQIRKEIRSAAHKLEGLLPEHFMVQRNMATGGWEIPANFWNALREKMGQEDSSLAWDTFIAENRAKLDQAAEESVERVTIKRSHIISQEMFIERIEQVASEVAERTATDLIRSLPPDMKGAKLLENLALANLARNTELAIQTVNYFSVGLGATVNPYLTSPTQVKKNVGRFRSWFSKHHKPLQALKRWDETTDCWCAAASDDKGKAQIGVLMPRPIIPTSITVEHIPARGTFDIGAAPREFEVWVTNTEKPFPPHLSGGLVPDLQCGDPPGNEFVCIGKGHYDIHGPNHVQNFALEAGDAGFVNEAVVKIKNNWGRDWTCLYRIRMHGEQEVIL